MPIHRNAFGRANSCLFCLRDEGFINHTHLVCVNLQRICNVRKDNDFEPGSVEFIRDSFIILVN